MSWAVSVAGKREDPDHVEPSRLRGYCDLAGGLRCHASPVLSGVDLDENFGAGQFGGKARGTFDGVDGQTECNPCLLYTSDAADE